MYAIRSYYGLEAAKLSVVPAIDLEMDDFIHISGSSQNRLGARCANAMHLLNNPDFEHKEPIRLKTAEIIENSDNWNCKVALTYDNVIGELVITSYSIHYTKLYERFQDCRFH